MPESVAHRLPRCQLGNPQHPSPPELVNSRAPLTRVVHEFVVFQVATVSKVLTPPRVSSGGSSSSQLASSNTRSQNSVDAVW